VGEIILGLAWFTIICLFIFVLSVTLDEIHKKGSGIKEAVLPTQYDFSPGIFSEMYNAIKERWNYLIRNKIKRFSESTPNPPLPITPSPLYDAEKLKQKRYVLEYSDINSNGNKLKISTSEGDLKNIRANISDINSNPSSNGKNINNGDRSTVSVEGKNIRHCKNCGQSFSYKHWNKQYCSEECRIENWEKRTGKKVRKGRRKG
jgi:predicted nucleic acid-binding Zn ribbon protein